MTRRVAGAGVLAVCLTALLVGLIAYGLLARDARLFENRILLSEAAHPVATLSARTGATQLAQVTAADGRVLRQTAALARLGQLPGLPLGDRNVVLAGRHLRVRTVRFRHRARLSVAVSDAPARATLRRLRTDVLIAALVGALAASLLLIAVTRRALAPVRHTADLADRIVSTGRLGERLPAAAGEDEIARLALSINRMLDHLEASDAALRRLVADASHELRSPVTTLRGNLELLTDQTMSGADVRDALADTRAEAERLGEMVEGLLTLARADTVAPHTEVDLPRLIRETAPSSEILAIPDGATVSGDPLALRALVRNLVENAERHAGEPPQVRLERDGRDWHLSIIDHGPGVPPAERELIFDRFRRGVRSAGTPGSGLGLAIVVAAARAHGGRVELTETPGGGATFHVRLPASGP